MECSVTGPLEECIYSEEIDKYQDMDCEATSAEVDVKPDIEDVNVELGESIKAADEGIVVKQEPLEFVATEAKLLDGIGESLDAGLIHTCVIPPCRSRFTRKCYLEIHLKRHSSVKQCTLCLKDFQSNILFLKHISQHLRAKAKEYKEDHLFCFHCCTQHTSRKALRTHSKSYCSKNEDHLEKREILKKLAKDQYHKARNKAKQQQNEIAKVVVKLEKEDNEIEKDECEFEDNPEYITISALRELATDQSSDVAKELTAGKNIDDINESTSEERVAVKEEKEDVIDNNTEDNYEIQNVNGGQTVNTTEIDETIQSDLWRKSSEYPACEVCGMKFRYMACVHIHMMVHTSSLHCVLCNDMFIPRFKEFSSHVYQHVKDKLAEYKRFELQCPYCGIRFKERKLVMIHMRIHTNERPFKCDICGNAFKQRNSLQTHQVTHSKEKPFTCQECGGKYTTSSSLKRHVRKMHNMQRNIKCGHCGMVFHNYQAAQDHRMEAHVGKLFKRYCSLCNEHFFSRVKYTAHVEMHKKSL
ncbi:unnamed protein product [Acanthoscelides obtectus]|nr:unnamed protein product [Acanthoscelides obtectus]CAK1643911.1 Zinc finger protein 358 [Acanthoscelides obtectus]